MPRDRLERLFPGLRAGDYKITSEIDPGYNCAAFAAGELEQWWDPYHPDGTWPDEVDRDVSVQHYIAVFERHGFVVCHDAGVESGFEKIVLYTDAAGDFCHASRQQVTGGWASKLGELEDIEHATLEAVVSPDYGSPAVFMKRPKDPG